MEQAISYQRCLEPWTRTLLIMEIKPSKSTRTEDVIEIYKLLVEMADRVSQRRQSANSFYLTVNTAIIGASAYVIRETQDTNIWIISLAGVAICILWIRSVLSYKSLNSVKFEVITELEKQLPVAAYSNEWRILNSKDGKRHTPFHKIEILVPLVFILLHLTQFLTVFPWETAGNGTKSLLSYLG